MLQNLNTKLLQSPAEQANMGIFFVENISLCLKSGTKIVHFKVNFVFFKQNNKKYTLSLTISVSELIVPDKIHKIYD